MLFIICHCKVTVSLCIVKLHFNFKPAVLVDFLGAFLSFLLMFHSFAAMALPVPKIKALWNLRGFLLVFCSIAVSWENKSNAASSVFLCRTWSPGRCRG